MLQKQYQQVICLEELKHLYLLPVRTLTTAPRHTPVRTLHNIVYNDYKSQLNKCTIEDLGFDCGEHGVDKQ